MKIIYVANIRLPTEKAHGIQIMKACEAFAQEGHSVELIIPHRANPLSKEDPFAYYHVKPSFIITRVPVCDLVKYGRIGFVIETLTFAVSAIHALRRREVDIVYGRDEMVVAGSIVCTRIPTVWESHDGAWNRIARFVARHAYKMVVVSHGLKAFYVERGIVASHIHATPNGIDLDAFSHPRPAAEVRTSLGLPVRGCIALYIGKLDGWKGADTLLEASRLLPPSITVAIIGGDTAQVEQLRVQYPHVLFVGYRPYSELPDNQCAGDMLIVPNTAKNSISVNFTSPLKLIAHLASHRPIIASNLPSIREIVSDGEAVLVTPDDPQALASAIIDLASSPQRAACIAENAFVRSQTFSWKVRAQGIVQHIQPHT